MDARPIDAEPDPEAWLDRATQGLVEARGALALAHTHLERFCELVSQSDEALLSSVAELADNCDDSVIQTSAVEMQRRNELSACWLHEVTTAFDAAYVRPFDSLTQDLRGIVR